MYPITLMTILSGFALAEEPSPESKKEAVNETPTEEAPTEEAPIVEEPKEGSDQIVVIHASMEEALTLARTHAALKSSGLKGIEIETLKPVILSDFIRSSSYQHIEGAELISCETTPVSLSRMRNMIQQAENEVSYLEFDKADGTLVAAEQSLNCLKDFADSSLAFQLYFLQGMVAYDNQKVEKARASFHQALTFQPTKRWDDYFAPDAKPLFDEIKEEIVKSKEYTLTVVPTPPQGSIWIDGYPADGNVHMLKAGAHLIQLNTGDKTSSYRIQTGEEDSRFIIPAALPPSAETWVDDDEKRPELSIIAGQVAEQNKGVVVANGSEVWVYDDETSMLKELDVPQRLYVGGRDPKIIASWAFIGAGSVAFATGGTLMAINSNRANTEVTLAQNAESYDDFSQAEIDYNTAEQSYKYGTAVLIGGTGLTAVGSALLLTF